jgi:hypothetical protein
MFTCPVSQKKVIQRQKSRLEALKQEAEEEKARAKVAARERVLLDFEKGQLKLRGLQLLQVLGLNRLATRTNVSILKVHLLYLVVSQCCTVKQGEQNANSNSMLLLLKHWPGRQRRLRFVR